MNIKELMIGNIIQDEKGNYFRVDGLADDRVRTTADGVRWYMPVIFSGIPITEEILKKCGFYQMAHRTVTNSWMCDLGWNRELSIGFVGTPNEMVFLYEVDENAEGLREITDIVIVHNYDYNGMLFLHQLQNLYFSITNKELEVKL